LFLHFYHDPQRFYSGALLDNTPTSKKLQFLEKEISVVIFIVIYFSTFRLGRRKVNNIIVFFTEKMGNQVRSSPSASSGTTNFAQPVTNIAQHEF